MAQSITKLATSFHQSSKSITTMSSSSSTSSQQQQHGGGGRELQGQRPAPLRVHKDSHTIRKPPPHPQLRQPVIIYTQSPKVVHADPADFMSVVQRLTGASSSSLQSQPPPPSMSTSSLQPPSFPFQLQPAAAAGAHDQLSPAARLAAIELEGHPRGRQQPAGILSPVPGSLQPAVPPSFFSPPGAGGINLFGELISPAIHAYDAAAAAGGGAAPNNYPTDLQYYLPSSTAAAAAAASPSPYYNWDLFNNHPNL